MSNGEKWWVGHRWIDSYLNRYFAVCGLLREAEKMLDDLPRELSEELGESEEFWKNVLTTPSSKVSKLNLLYGALEFAVNKAESLSKKYRKPFCFYLKRALENKWPSRWLIGFVRSMVPLKRLKESDVA
ncbi:MAG TPA: hypothetical protein ENG61_01335 [Candidatus Korarchaeota archaeon]|nr:hypothetical protein [Candidatus Korarchaeota archaeon]